MGAGVIARVEFCLMLLASAAFAQGPLVSVDEDGYGDFSGTPLPFLIAPDPTIPTFSPTLMYLLPAQVVPGDVIFLEPGDTAPTPCDLLRFLNLRSQGILLFYSEKTDAEESGDLADVGLPPNAQANGVRFNLDGGVRSDAFMYTPGFQDPGYFMLPGATASTAYNVIGILPEPLSSLPFLLAFLLCLRRQPARSRNAIPYGGTEPGSAPLVAHHCDRMTIARAARWSNFTVAGAQEWS